AVALARWRQGGKRHAAAIEHGMAFSSILAEPGELLAGRPSWRVIEVERSPGIVFGVFFQPSARSQEQGSGYEQGHDEAVERQAGRCLRCAQWKSRDFGITRTFRGCPWRKCSGVPGGKGPAWSP